MPMPFKGHRCSRLTTSVAFAMFEFIVKVLAVVVGFALTACGEARPSRAGAAAFEPSEHGNAAGSGATYPSNEGGALGHGGSSGGVSCDTIAAFPDPQLDAVLRGVLSLSSNQSFGRDHLLRVTELEHDASEGDEPVRSLEGVECLLGLRSLAVTGRVLPSGERDGVLDVTPLARLEQLRSLTIRHATFDLAPLGALVQLRELRLDHAAPGSNAEPGKVDALASLVNLNVLDLSHGCIQDISAVAGMPSLETLDLSSNCIEDLSPLEGLVTLAHADVSGNEYDCAQAADTLELLSSYGAAVVDDCG